MCERWQDYSLFCIVLITYFKQKEEYEYHCRRRATKSVF